MRKLNKKCSLSTKYRDWEKGLNKSKTKHPEYTHTFRFYWDVVMNLFYCQDGLCAYTEKRLCPQKYYDIKNWKNGRYKSPNRPKKPKIKGQLEHFATKLKYDKAWLWSNLFMADTDINNRAKNIKTFPSYLKPDHKNYDEFSLFEYDRSIHMFRANITLPKAQQDIVNEFVDAIMNFDPFIDERREFLESKLKLIDWGHETWTSIEIKEFPTAFKMLEKAINKKP